MALSTISKVLIAAVGGLGVYYLFFRGGISGIGGSAGDGKSIEPGEYSSDMDTKINIRDHTTPGGDSRPVWTGGPISSIQGEGPTRYPEGDPTRGRIKVPVVSQPIAESPPQPDGATNETA